MKEYPSIDREIRFGEPIYAFDKLDGSNIRAEWNKKRKFWKFGTRTQLISNSDKTYGEAVAIVVGKYERDLHDMFVANRYEKAICFFEFWGRNSFAGTHIDEEHDVTLFDISVHKKGILPPKEFVKEFGHLDIAKLLYCGNANHPFVEQVRNRQLDGMTFEGVVCKGKIEFPGLPLMFKVKSHDWINKLKNKCSGDQKLFEKLV